MYRQTSPLTPPFGILSLASRDPACARVHILPLHMTKLTAESDDLLYEGDDVSFRAMRTKSGKLPAKEWLESLDPKYQIKFLNAAEQIEVDIRDGRRSGRTELVPESDHRLMEIRITRPGQRGGPHLRMLGLRVRNTIWVAEGFKKQTTHCGQETYAEQIRWQPSGKRLENSMGMSDRYRELLRDPSLRREYEREALYEGAISNIHGILNARGMTQAELAKRLGLSPGRVSQLLSGGRNLTLKTLADLAWALGLRAEMSLKAIEDLASTPALTDDPIIPAWLDNDPSAELADQGSEALMAAVQAAALTTAQTAALTISRLARNPEGTSWVAMPKSSGTLRRSIAANYQCDVSIESYIHDDDDESLTVA